MRPDRDHPTNLGIEVDSMEMIDDGRAEDLAADRTVDRASACPKCQSRRDNYQAIGIVVFFVSLVTCGMLMPISYPLTIFLVYQSSKKCPDCRT